MGIDELDRQVGGLEVRQQSYEAAIGQGLGHLVVEQADDTQPGEARLGHHLSLVAGQSRDDGLAQRRRSGRCRC